MDTESMNIKMGKYTKDFGKMTNKKVKAKNNLQMEVRMKEISRMV